MFGGNKEKKKTNSEFSPHAAPEIRTISNKILTLLTRELYQIE